MKVIYVAHPFRGDEIVNAGKVARICRELHKDYPDYLFVSPIHAFSWFLDDHDGALEHCLRMLARCDEVLFFGEWWNSDGCQRELAYAIRHNMRIFVQPEGRDCLMPLEAIGL